MESKVHSKGGIMEGDQPIRSPYIVFADVQVRYSEETHGLRGVSLTVCKGDFVFLLGETGAGKSTLLKCLTREVRYDGGKILLHGRDVNTYRDREIPYLRRDMGIVPQDSSLLPNKTVFENVAYAMRAAGHSRNAVRKKIPDILDKCMLGAKVTSFPHQLSGGEKQRVAIARALINTPPLLIADEPTANLDYEHSVEIMELLKSFNQKGMTVLVATHDMPIVEKMGRRIVRLKDGLLMSDEAPSHAVIQDAKEMTANV